MAAIPTIPVAIVASITLDRTLDQLFSVSNRLIIQYVTERRPGLSA